MSSGRLCLLIFFKIKIAILKVLALTARAILNLGGVSGKIEAWVCGAALKVKKN